VTTVLPARAPVPTRTSFDDLVRTHAASVSNYLRRRIYPLPATDLDDLLAETFIVVWKREGDVPQGAQLPWILGVARKVLANAQRTQRRRLPREHQGYTDRALPPAEDAAVAQDTLDTALAALTGDERDILLAQVWDGLTSSDIAVLYGLTPNAAAIRLSRAREKFIRACAL
jgi:RNA polymerase sigma factor (sigma-70 family)